MKITLPDYFRIYSIMHSVLKSENADTNKSCSFYNYCGAYILNEHYKLPAKVYFGFAAYHLGGENILGFGKMDGNTLSSNSEEFHTWIELDGWLIDFMAPEFPNVLKELTSKENVPRKMMQKPLSKMVEYADDISQAGDFLLLPDLEVTNAIMSNIEKQPAFIDLIEICSKWYSRRSGKMSRSIQISDGRGSIKEVSIEDIAPIVGAW
ncbi:DUF2026 domain-containing protein [Vibrio kanaloae]|uniref:DUF2026 family protein n=1 Tax=Vibrio kanaloae TaxID=170673 RepID=UPI0010BEF2D7|nr:DUF2026 family protein [Vibrio kanaloae]TKF79828.1 DUF2026 domain-containing protein [Vibrio kanaloae]